VYLVRHTEPVLPDERWRFMGGRSDPPLSPRGIQHALELSRQLSPVCFDYICSSDLRRSLMTAQIIADSAYASGDGDTVPVHPDARLREIDLGLWEGLTRDEAAERFPEEYEARERDPLHYRFPGGESFDDLRSRVVPAYQEITAAAGTRILVVAHKGVNRVILCDSLGLPFDRLFSLRQEYGCVSLLAPPDHLALLVDVAPESTVP
jgi:broad specificity phosphatase PhoE